MPHDSLRGRRVLVVEDEFYLADELDGALRDAGADVLGPVPSVEAALDLPACQAAPDVAVLDMNLGGDMAFPIADELVARGIPFLFTTGYDAAALPARHGAVRRLEKPVNETTVVRELGRLLGA